MVPAANAAGCAALSDASPPAAGGRRAASSTRRCTAPPNARGGQRAAGRRRRDTPAPRHVDTGHRHHGLRLESPAREKAARPPRRAQRPSGPFVPFLSLFARDER